MMNRACSAAFWLGFLLLPIISALASEKDSQVVEQTLEELGWEGQIGQMAQIDIAVLLSDDGSELRQDLLDHYIGELGIGSVLNNVAKGDKMWKIPDFRAASVQIQQTAKKFNRPPVIWGLDSVHGANYLYNTITTPQPLNLAATFNTTTAFLAGRWASVDTRRAGIPWLFSPLLGLSWEPSWSRVYETFGEDPVVVGSMAQAMIEGIQFRETNSSLIPSRAAACAKHWVGYSMPHNGHDRAPSWIPLRQLHQYFLLPWKQIINQVDTVMESYTEIDGVPNVANRYTLNRLLRKQLGFEGLVVTDYHEIDNLFEWHHTASDRADAVKKTLEEGTVDMSMIANDPDDFFRAMRSLNGTQFQSRVKASARRVLKLKQKLNMFEEAFLMENSTDDYGPTQDDLIEALRMTTESIILAQNNDEVLPLDSNAPLKVLVTGPTSRSRSFQTGGWTYQWQGVDSNKEDQWFTYGSTVYDAMNIGSWEVSYKCGVDILGQDCQEDDALDDQEEQDDGIVDTMKGWVGWRDDDSDRLSIERAMDQAKDTDVIIVCIGEENYAEKPGDIRSSRLPAGQYELVAGLRQAAPDAKIVAVYFGGRPRLLLDVVEHADAVLLGFLAGPLAGDALRDIVTGTANPSGKLPITYPKFEDGGGVPYLHTVSDMCTKDTGGSLPHWENAPCEVEWPFGHGHSYSTFEYENLSVSSHSLGYDRKAKEVPTLTISVTVTNKGLMAGADTVMFFSFDGTRASTPEYKRLRGFEKVWLEPGDSTKVTLNISLDDLRFIGPHDNSHFILQDGMNFQVGVGADTDCRTDHDDDHCSDPITIHTDPEYVGACEAACNLWTTSGCDSHFGMTPDSCWDMCTSIHQSDELSLNNDGWGWNYVECIESIIFEDSFETGSCWTLKSFCRDVLSTPNMDEFGNGPTPAFANQLAISPVTLVLALLSGLASSAMVAYIMRGGRCSKRKGEQYGDVQFSQVRTDHELMLT